MFFDKPRDPPPCHRLPGLTHYTSTIYELFALTCLGSAEHGTPRLPHLRRHQDIYGLYIPGFVIAIALNPIRESWVCSPPFLWVDALAVFDENRIEVGH